MKYFFQKFKESSLSLLPIMLVVLILYFSFAGISVDLLWKFLLGILILDIGETLFLIGIDGSVMKMGDHVGETTSRFSKLFVTLFFGFLFGVFATVAEPDVSVLATQVNSNGINVARFLFIFIIGAGVGVFVAVALLRIVKNFNYKLLMAIIFAVIFITAIFVPNNLIAIAFDVGGATTGIVTSPFLLAISAGIARNKPSQTGGDNFGVIGVASTGPILAVLFLTLLTAGNSNAEVIESAANTAILLEVLFNATIAIFPLLLIFTIFDVCLVKLPKSAKLSILLASIITYIGLFMFLFGINFGVMNMGTAIGNFLATESTWIAVVLSVIIGFLITFSEPAVKVLGKQVEDVTMGNIKKSVVIISIALAMMFAVTLSTLKIIYGFSIWWIVGIGYGVAFLVIPFSSSTFTSIAFDSGGVASGPMSAAFILPLMIGYASGIGNASDGFGLIACIALMPILVLEILGASYQFKLKMRDGLRYRKALELSFGIDVYSNIDALEDEYNKMQLAKEAEMTKKEQKENEKLIARLQAEAGARKEDDGEQIQG